MLLELLQQDRNRTLQLRVMPSGHILRQLFHLDVGRDAVAFHFPLAVQTIDPIPRRGDPAAIDPHRPSNLYALTFPAVTPVETYPVRVEAGKVFIKLD